MNTLLDNEIKLKLLKLLEKEPQLTQREMNKKMGISLGKINYCISALSEKGMIRIDRFKQNRKKSSYIYRLTPKGFEEIVILTLAFLKIKINEYDIIKQEIRLLSKEVDRYDPKIIKDLKINLEKEKSKGLPD